MMENNSVLHDPKEEEEEALSPCDTTSSSSKTNTTRRSSSEPAELFSFLSSSENIMCPAEDMIFCGRLISSSQSVKTLSKDDKKPHPPGFRRRSESLSELQSTSTTRSKSTRTSINNILTSSRSLDYQKLRRFSSSKTSPDSDMDRNSSFRRSDKLKAVKPRWYLFMFGMVKFPPEMDLQDIKSRQFRRNSSSVLFPQSESDGNFPAHRGSGKSSWKLLKALSCKDHASIAVTTSFYLPQV
ncbi:hypothetical protein Ddye_021505 [Dipteronia dyeriana]|uniref:Uncharacterized protein n=1 Tax=Dipteronia dyeriana TaxID=168575 RepID=A0AAD9U1S6_9ROSI|nr:hypothetical protein Ddye_021505 [Dipteronia dyeriana]